MLYIKTLWKNAFHLLWTEITEVIFSMIKDALEQFRESKRHTKKKGADDPKEFISNDNVICSIRRTFLGQLNFMRKYFFTANTSAEQILL